MIVRIENTSVMHRAVVHGEVVYLGGVVADNFGGGMGVQTREICEKLDVILAKAGSSKRKLLSVRIFVTDMSKKEEMNEVWKSWLDASDMPARATIGVADLGSKDILIEVVATAAA